MCLVLCSVTAVSVNGKAVDQLEYCEWDYEWGHHHAVPGSEKQINCDQHDEIDAAVHINVIRLTEIKHFN